MSNWENFLDKFSDGIVYFKNTFEEAVLKSIPGEGIFVKLKGGEEFKAKKGSALVADAILEASEITKEEYNTY